MGNFEDFIRYGLPGYIFLISLLFALGNMPFIRIDLDLIKNYASIIGTTLLIMGPLVGFLIHQVYFIYFDRKESYNKLSRNCIQMIYVSYLESGFFKPDMNIEQVEKNSFVAWKFLSTNFDANFKIESLFLSRLRSSRNYSHAFGAILTSIIIAFCVIVASIVSSFHITDILIILVVCLLGVFWIFLYKRRELMARIEEMETGIVLLNLEAFTQYTNRLIELEAKHTQRIKLFNDKHATHKTKSKTD